MPHKKVYIIAEAGVNHNGDIRLAKKLVDAAKQAGADAVKFQSFTADRLAKDDSPIRIATRDAQKIGTQR